MILGGCQVLGCFVATLIVNKAGRKSLLIISLLICCLSMAALGTTNYLTNSDNHSLDEHIDQILRWLSLVFLITFVLGFTLGLGPVPWILLGELKPGEPYLN